MPIPNTAPQIVMFAIQSAVKLGGALRQSYVQNLQGKELTIPLPKVNMDISVHQMTMYFEGHESALLENERIKELYDITLSDKLLTSKEEIEYRRLFNAVSQLDNQDPTAEVTGNELVVLSTYRQWSSEEEEPTNGLRLVAGNLIEVGIDYFSQVPGAINPNSKYAASLQGVLEAFDKIDLSSREGQSQALKQLAPQLFASAMEVTSLLLPNITSDPKFQHTISQTCSGVANELCQRIEEYSTSSEKVAAKQWGKVIFESTVRHAGHTLIAETSQNKDTAAFVSKVSVSVMNTLLDQDLKGMKLKDVVSGPAIDALLEASLAGLAANADWVTQDQAVGTILSGVATSVMETGFQRKNLIPELARLTIQQTSLNLDKLIHVSPDNPHSLLLTATRTLLQCLSEPVPGDAWKPNLSNTELLSLADTLLLQVAENPNWVTSEVGGTDSILGEVLHISLSTLRTLPEEKRFSGVALKTLLQDSVQAVAMNRILLKPLPVMGEAGNTALQYALNAAFSKVYNREDTADQWGLAKDAAISELVSKALTDIAKQPISVSMIDKTIELHFGGVESDLMRGLLHSLDGLSLDNGFKSMFTKQLAPALLQESVSILEEKSPKWIAEPSFRKLIQQSSQTIAQQLSERLSDEEMENTSWRNWASEVSTTLLDETGTLAFSASIDLFIDTPETREIVEQVGLSVIDAAVQSELPLKEVLKGDSLREVVAAGLKVASDYPEIFGNNNALSDVINGIVKAVSDSGIKRPNLIPEIIRTVLEKGQSNLHLIWQPSSNTGNLLALAVNHTLTLLVAPPRQGVWKPNFTQAQLMGVVSTVVDEVVENPAWILDSMEDQSLLQNTLKSTLEAAGSIPHAERLSPRTWEALIKQSLKSVGLRQQLLDRLPGEPEQKATVLGYTIDALLNHLFDNESPQVKWAATKTEILNVLIEHVLNKVAIGPATPGTANQVIDNLKVQLDKLRDNDTFDSVMFLRQLLL